MLEVKLTDGSNHILLATREGKSIRFNEKDVRAIGRTGTGVIGINLGSSADNEVIGMVCVADNDEEATILVVSEKGIGKRTLLDEYRAQSRGGKGVKTINITSKTVHLIAIKSATDDDDMVIINKSGLTIRLAVKNVPTTGRATQGVKLINLKGKDAIADVGLIKDAQLMDDDAVTDGEDLDTENTSDAENTDNPNQESKEDDNKDTDA